MLERNRHESERPEPATTGLPCKCNPQLGGSGCGGEREAQLGRITSPLGDTLLRRSSHQREQSFRLRQDITGCYSAPFLSGRCRRKSAVMWGNPTRPVAGGSACSPRCRIFAKTARWSDLRAWKTRKPGTVPPAEFSISVHTHRYGPVGLQAVPRREWSTVVRLGRRSARGRVRTSFSYAPWLRGSCGVPAESAVSP